MEVWMARDCGHTGTGMTWFDVGADCLALCSRCYAAVTQPWHDKLRETSAALAEAQRENEELRATSSQIVRLFRDFAKKVDPDKSKPMANAIDALCDVLELDSAIREARRGE